LELQRLRELVLDDEVELLASRLDTLHRLLGGDEVPSGRHRALARELLAAGDLGGSRGLSTVPWRAHLRRPLAPAEVG